MLLINCFIMQKHKAQLPVTINWKIFTLVQLVYENADNEKVVQKICSKLSNIQSGHLSEEFKNRNIILLQKQPKNILQLLTRVRFNTEINHFGHQNGLFKSADKCCKISSLYSVEMGTVITSYLQINSKKTYIKKLFVIISLD